MVVPSRKGEVGLFYRATDMVVWTSGRWTVHPTWKAWEGLGRRGEGTWTGSLDPLKALQAERDVVSLGRVRAGKGRRRVGRLLPWLATVLTRAGKERTGRSQAANRPEQGTQGRPLCPAADGWKAKPFSQGS